MRIEYRRIAPKNQEFPARLKTLGDCPKYLDVVGRILPQDELAVAVVGTRKFTSYGREATERIVGGLAAAGVTIVSGLALGIDTFAHQAALNAGGRTLAVLGTGIEVIYPPQNKDLYFQVAASGAVLSELDPHQESAPWTFPNRNRIISGLALAVLVVEAAAKSGALITADWAARQGRDVLAVPGSIFSPVSYGPNALIKSGAYPATSTQDILEVLEVESKIKKQKARRKLPQSKEEEVLLKLLAEGPQKIDDLVEKSRLSVSTVGATLSLMEMKGLVKNLGAQEYRGA